MSTPSRGEQLFSELTESETWTLITLLKQGYARSRIAAFKLRDEAKRHDWPFSPAEQVLLSARRGSLAAVRSDITWTCTQLVNHLRDLEVA